MEDPVASISIGSSAENLEAAVTHVQSAPVVRPDHALRVGQGGQHLQDLCRQLHWLVGISVSSRGGGGGAAASCPTTDCPCRSSHQRSHNLTDLTGGRQQGEQRCRGQCSHKQTVPQQRPYIPQLLAGMLRVAQEGREKQAGSAD